MEVGRRHGRAIALTMYRAVWLTLVLLQLGACRQLSQVVAPQKSPPEKARISLEELRLHLNQFRDRYSARIQAAADEIARRCDSAEMRRSTVVLKIRGVDSVNSSLSHPDPRAAFVDTWTLAVQQRILVESGDGRDVFGRWTEIALAAFQKTEEDIARIGRLWLIPDELTKVEQEVHAFAHQYPLSVSYAREGRVQPSTADAATVSTLSKIVDVPLAPFRSLGSIDQGAAAVRDFTGVADRFTRVVADFPELTRWNLELLFYDLERHPAVTSNTASFDLAAQSLDRIIDVADTLPGRVRAELTQGLEELEAKQETLHATMAEARETLTEAKATLTEMTAAGGAWESTLRIVDGWVQAAKEDSGKAPTTPAPDARESRGFDIRDYESTAVAIDGAGAELRDLLADVRELTRSGELESTLGTFGAQTNETLEGTIDHLFWRSLELALAIAVLVFVYRRIAARWPPHRDRAST